MRVTRLALRDFRSYTAADVRLGGGVTVVHGRNGAGKTNLLEALYLGCTGASWRTSSDRELVRFGAEVARIEVEAEAEDGRHTFAVGLQPGERRRAWADGTPVGRLADAPQRPLAAVFVPDRLELVKGGPGLRRAHVDQLVAALWPARSDARRAYGQALAQRNALLARGAASAAASLEVWDSELARLGLELMRSRAAAVDELRPRFSELADRLGLEGAELRYRPRSRATEPQELAAELRERRDRDIERGFTVHGPHRDDLILAREGRELRVFGSQGQQRQAVLSLLLAEREAIAAVRGRPPLLLLDDALSELDSERRELLLARLVGSDAGGNPDDPDSQGQAGQAVITTTDPSLVPPLSGATTRLAVSEGVVLGEATAA
jgi:DNA replication and repair protein RecF